MLYIERNGTFLAILSRDAVFDFQFAFLFTESLQKGMGRLSSSEANYFLV